MLRVTIPKKVQTRFKLKAIRAFPRELIGFLIGRRDGDRFEVVDIWYPEDQKRYASETEVDVQDRWWVEAAQHGASRKLIVLGTVHTHTYRLEKDSYFDPVQSKDDHGSWTPLDQITGIANVVERRSGKKCEDIQFWGPTVQVEVTVK